MKNVEIFFTKNEAKYSMKIINYNIKINALGKNI